jgi:FdhD protein
MATPADLTDLAVGFSLTEGIIGDIGEIEELTVIPGPDGIELRLWLRPNAGRRLKERRRHLVGPTGCGLCGIDSLREAGRIAQCVEQPASLTPEQISTAIAVLTESQILNHKTRAAHAAGFFRPGSKTMMVREDVGRHNALDKVIGWAHGQGLLPLADAILCVSGRLSFELVQKAAVAGCPLLVAVGAPSSLAVELARDRGITLCGFVRDGRVNVYSEPWRISD